MRSLSPATAAVRATRTGGRPARRGGPVTLPSRHLGSGSSHGAVDPRVAVARWTGHPMIEACLRIKTLRQTEGINTAWTDYRDSRGTLE